MSRSFHRRSKPLSPQPPRAAEWILEHLHPDGGDYTHLGDFREVFAAVLAEKGRGAALRWYWAQVLRSLPGFVLNKLYWSLSLLRNYIVISIRNFRKSAGFSLITLLGLAAGMACFILILAYARFETSYDRFHEKTGRIYRLTSGKAPPGGKPSEFGANHPSLLASLLKREFPEVRHAARVFARTDIPAVLQAGDKTFTQSGLIVDQDFLEVFTFPLLRGDKDSALSSPGSIVLTASTARKLFRDQDPLLRTIRFREERGAADVTVTGVAQDIPRNSSFRFDYLVSVASLEADKKNDYMFDNWDVGNFFIFVELAGPGQSKALEEKFSSWLERERAEQHAAGLGFYLEPIEDVHLRSNIRGQLATNNEIHTLRLFLAIAIITLLIASINYMNIVTARSATRAREIGIRKVTGAGRGRLFEQFLGEAIVFALMSLLAALAVVWLALPRFAAAVGVDLKFHDLANGPFLLLVFGITVVMGLLSGAYPALVLSAFQPVRVFREHAASGQKGVRLRNLLVVGQFTASIVLVVCTLVVFGQLHFISSQKLGFDREHVVVVPIREGETAAKAETIRTALLRLPEVRAVSVTSGLPTKIESTLINAGFTTDRGEKIKFSYHFDFTDENFLDVFGVELVAGRNFSPGNAADKNAVLVNETLVKTAGWVEGVGTSFHEPTGPMALMPGGDSNLALRIRPGDVPKTIAEVRDVFEANTNTQPFGFFFLEDSFDALYRKERRTGEIFGAFAILAVIIASLGLLGLAAFAVERRTKEIGIRKVMGATSLRLAARLSRDFILLVLFANLVAWPVAYYAMSQWLEGFASRIGLGAQPFLLAGIGALLITLITVGTQSLRAAVANPVDALRYE
jgi:putative ABC transport system permease protein